MKHFCIVWCPTFGCWAECLVLTVSQLGRIWNRNGHPRRNKGPAPGSSQHRLYHRCGSGAEILGKPLHWNSHTTVAIKGMMMIYFRCGSVEVKRRLSAGTHYNICPQTLGFILEPIKNMKQSTEGYKAKINRIFLR